MRSEVRRNTADFKLALPRLDSWLLVLGSPGLDSVVSYLLYVVRKKAVNFKLVLHYPTSYLMLPASYIIPNEDLTIRVLLLVCASK
ncbi:hypothetical protein SAMN05421813_10191 [Daejeonella rubra]|uniref:Uncharacterized protein n=1 Tax=Daejeonella rubra TaxID=990371 RepID=A0A1G9LTY5_9SPHI|nr:hypothetical protein SAMN05421813_10191 [Daejeonella rubra]